MLRILLLLTFLLFHARPAFGQWTSEVDVTLHSLEDSLYSRNMARTKFESSQASLQELKAKRLEAVWTEAKERKREFLAGRGTAEFFYESCRNLLRAELDMSDNLSDRKAAYELYWRYFWLIEALTRNWNDQGRIPTKMYFEAKFHRMEAEVWNHRISKEATKPELERKTFEIPEEPPSHAFLDSRAFAQARFQASLSNPDELLHERVRFIEMAFGSRMKECLAGRCTLDFLLEVSRLVLEARLAVSSNYAERTSHLVFYWIVANELHEMNLRRFASGRILIEDVVLPNYFRLDAAIRLLKFEAVIENGGTRFIPREPYLLPHSISWDCCHYSDSLEPILRLKNLAKDKFTLLADDPRKMAAEKVEMSRIEWESREKQFVVGRGTQDILIESSLRLLEADLAVSVNQKARVAALERHWERMLFVELVNRARYEHNRIPIQDYMQSQFYRLDAEIRMAEGRKK